LLAPEDFSNRIGACLPGRCFLPGEFFITLLLVALEPVIARFEAMPGAFGSSLFVRLLANARFSSTEIGSQWDVAGAYKVTATALDAVDQSMRAHLFLVVRTGVPEQLLWQ
jgi:hypothetical protein